MKTSEIFNALPHVDKIWLTKDGHFHLHPHYGGKEVERDDADDSEVTLGKEKDAAAGTVKESVTKEVKISVAKKTAAPKKPVAPKKVADTKPVTATDGQLADIKDVVKLINTAITAEEVDTFVGEDKRPGVVKAAKTKKATFTTGE